MVTAGRTWIRRGDGGFAEAVRGPAPNARVPDRAPDAIVAPDREEAVVDAVRAARRAGLRIAVRSGGHSWIAAAVRADGLLVDLGAMNSIEIDRDRALARVGPAVLGRDLGRRLAADGLAFPIGHCGGPAMGGYLLGGGIGLNWVDWGLACYAVRRIRVVTPEGDLVVADEDHCCDLLWLARGCGPGFPGIVTGFELELRRRPRDTRVSTWMFDLEDLDAVTRWVVDRSGDLPPNVELTVGTFGPARAVEPAGAGAPDHVVRVAATIFADEAVEAERAVAPLVAGPGVASVSHASLVPVAFEQLHAGSDASFPDGLRYAADTHWTGHDVHDALMAVAAEVARAPSPRSRIHAIVTDNGRDGAPGHDEGAYSMHERTLVVPYAVWEDARDDDANRRWVTSIGERMAPVTAGHFISEADLETHPARLEGSFSAASWERIRELRGRHDPDGVFHGYPVAPAP